MRQTQTASSCGRTETRVADAARAVLKGLTRMLESLGPQPRLEPIPVRVRGAASRRG